jgi:hypothetical protein
MNTIYLTNKMLRRISSIKRTIYNFIAEKKWDHKIKDICSQNKILQVTELDKKKSEEIRSYWRNFDINCNTLWHQAYIAVNEKMDPRYIPESFFYMKLEPRFNRIGLCLAYEDKNIYHKLFPDIKMPEIILRNINGMYFNERYEKIDRTELCKLLKLYNGIYIIKPSLDSGGGKKILALRISDGDLFINKKSISFDDLEQMFIKDFLIQNKLDQYEPFQQIYPHSLNTIRMLSFRFGGKIHILSSILRMGNHGKFVDNESSGGISCGITNDGVLKHFAIDLYFHKYDMHPFTKVSFGNIKIPMYDSVIKTVIKMHNQLHYFDLTSWDIAIDKGGEVNLIELNLVGQAINFHQLNNGPLFNDMTSDVLAQMQSIKSYGIVN